VNSDSIANCFSKAGFGVTTFNKNVEGEQIDEDWKKVSESQSHSQTELTVMVMS
jgi:hypothetical protein